MSGEKEQGHKADVCDEGKRGGEGRNRRASEFNQVKCNQDDSRLASVQGVAWRGVTVRCHVRPLTRIYL